jgi:glucose-6-phosphate isomerase
VSNAKTNKFEGALPFILSEFASVDCEDLEDGCMEIFGEDDHGNEGSCEVEINELAQAALDEINHLNDRVRELESDLKIALSDKTLDLVRCGIGGNYGGNCYETAMLKHHAPLVEMQEQLRIGGE